MKMIEVNECPPAYATGECKVSDLLTPLETMYPTITALGRGFDSLIYVRGFTVTQGKLILLAQSGIPRLRNRAVNFRHQDIEYIKGPITVEKIKDYADLPLYCGFPDDFSKKGSYSIYKVDEITPTVFVSFKSSIKITSNVEPFEDDKPEKYSLCTDCFDIVCEVGT